MSLKGAIGRRIFAKALPAVPLAASQVRGDLGGLRVAPPPTPGRSACGEKNAPDTLNPHADLAYIEKRKKLDAARKWLYEDNNYREGIRKRERLQAFTTIDSNIAALRSVSDQHKIRMQIDCEERMTRDRESWQLRVLAMFGLDGDRSARYDLF